MSSRYYFYFFFLLLFVSPPIHAELLPDSCGKYWEKVETYFLPHYDLPYYIEDINIHDISFNDSLFTAIGSALTDDEVEVKTYDGSYRITKTKGLIASSSDGVFWNQSFIKITEELYDIKWNGSQWIIVGDNGMILSSSDGENWQKQISGTSYPLYDINWNGSQWITVGNNGTILSSSDGKNWQKQISGQEKDFDISSPYFPKFTPLWSATWNGFLWMVKGSEEKKHNGTTILTSILLTSNDGINWQKQSLPTLYYLRSIKWNGSQWVAVGDFGTIISSGDGINWINQQSGISNNLRSISWNGSQWVAVSSTKYDKDTYSVENSVIVTSNDGVNWKNQSSDTPNDLYSVRWNGFQWLIIGEDEKILTSTNGKNWEHNVSNHDLSYLFWHENQWLSIGYRLNHVVVSYCDEYNLSNKLFDWAEKKYEKYFNRSAQPTINGDGYLYRHYPETGNYIGTKNGRIYVFSDIFGGLQDVGSLSNYIKTVNYDNYEDNSDYISGSGSVVTGIDEPIWY